MDEQLYVVKLLPLKQQHVSLSNSIVWIFFLLERQFLQVLDEGELVSFSNCLTDHHVEVCRGFGIILTPLDCTFIEILLVNFLTFRKISSGIFALTFV